MENNNDLEKLIRDLNDHMMSADESLKKLIFADKKYRKQSRILKIVLIALLSSTGLSLAFSSLHILSIALLTFSAANIFSLLSNESAIRTCDNMASKIVQYRNELEIKKQGYLNDTKKKNVNISYDNFAKESLGDEMLINDNLIEDDVTLDSVCEKTLIKRR